MAQEKKQQVSDKLMPKEIAIGDVKTFKLLNAGKIDPATGLPANNAGATFLGTATIYDEGLKRPVFIKNIVGETTYEDEKGNQVTKEIIEDIVFDGSGMTYVNHTEPNKYLVLSRSNACSTNKFRDKQQAAIWEEILPIDIKERQKFVMDLEFDAMLLVKKGEPKEVLAIAEVLADKRLISVNLSGSISDVRFEVERYCKVNPAEVIRASKEKLPKIKLDIQDLINLQELEFFNDGNEWQWVNKSIKDKTIMKVPAGQDPIDTLANKILSEEEANNEAPADKKKITILKEIKNTLKELSV